MDAFSVAVGVIGGSALAVKAGASADAIEIQNAATLVLKTTPLLAGAAVIRHFRNKTEAPNQDFTSSFAEPKNPGSLGPL